MAGPRSPLSSAAIQLTVGRVVLGVVALAAPRPLLRVFGFSGEPDARLAYAMRLYGVRELLIGLHLWREAAVGEPTLLTARLNLAIDAIDASMSFAMAATRPEIRRGALAVGVFASFITTQWFRFERRVALAARAT